MKKYLLALALLGSTGTAVQAQVANAGMENWHSYFSGALPPVMLEAPNEWYGVDSLIANFSILLGGIANQQVFKTTDAHSGSFAAKVVTRTQGTLGEVPGVLLNAKPNFNLMDSTASFSGGASISGWVDTVYAWVKYEHPGAFPEDDTAQMMALAFKTGTGAGGADSLVGIGVNMIMPAGSYVKAGLKMVYTSPVQPDKLILIFSSSPFSMSSAFGSTTALDGSTLFVDDVSVVMSPTGVPAVSFNAPGIQVYPNPVNELLQVTAPAGSGLLCMAVYNTSGQQVLRQRFDGRLQLNTSGLAAGMYLYQIRNLAGQLVTAGKFQVAR